MSAKYIIVKSKCVKSILQSFNSCQASKKKKKKTPLSKLFPYLHLRFI